MLAPTYTVFGRISPVRHFYEEALVNWQGSRDEAKIAIACNIRHDHRVSLEREQAFDDFCHQPRTAEELQQAFSYYFREKIRTKGKPHFIYPHFVYFEINGNNLIHGHPKLSTLSASSKPAINKEQKLVRILDINNLRNAFRWLRDVSHRRPKWEDSFKAYYSSSRTLASRDEQQWIDTWLDMMLDPHDTSCRENFIEAVLEMLNCIRHEKAFQPTWATTWEAFESHAMTTASDPNPDRWVQILGLGKNLPGHWYIVLTYKVAEAGTLARPTQLDSDWYEYHFPSPEETPLEWGGHLMDLRITPAATALLPEYIHKQIEHPIKHWNDTGRLLGRTSDWRCPGLLEIRRAHQRLLAYTYGTNAHTICLNHSLCGPYATV